jgi:hypothetical protein
VVTSAIVCGTNDQPTKKLTKGGVSPSASHRSLLGLTIPANETHSWKWWTVPCKLLRGVCLRERGSRRGGMPRHVQTSGCCYWWEDDTIRWFVLTKEILVGWMSESWTQKGWDRFGWWPLGGGGGVWLKASMIGEGGPCPFWIIPWYLHNNWGKARKALVRVVECLKTPLVAPTWPSF